MVYHKLSRRDPYLRKALFEVYAEKCAYCGDLLQPKNMHVDHILAARAKASNDVDFNAYLDELRGKGFDTKNPDYIENYFPTCPGCNLKKNNRNFLARNLRAFHDEAEQKTQDILKKIEQYKAKAPADLDMFRPEKLDIMCLTKMPPWADSENVICRGKELDEITKLIESGKDILLMSGFGGIGKTSLARLVFHSVKDRFDEVAWVPYNGNLKNSMLASIELEEDLRDPEERWQMIRALKNDGKKKLFVIDNADHNDNQDPQKDADLQSLSGWSNTTVIVTSRLHQLGSYQPYSVGFLPKEEDCIELFYLYYENDPELTQLETVRKLLKLARNHTFTIELLAKSANCEDDLAQFHQELEEKGFSFPEIEVDTAHNEVTATIAEHLKILFDMRTRTPVQTELLWDFAVLPVDASLNKTEIKDWFGIDVNQCERLVSDGWLSRKEGRYAMHPLVREIIGLHEAPEDTAEHFLAYLENYHSGYYLCDEDYIELTRRAEIANTVSATVYEGRDMVYVACFINILGQCCHSLARYREAIKYNKKVMTIKENKRGTNCQDLFKETDKNTLLCYISLNELQMILGYYEKVLPVYEYTIGKEHLDMAVIYHILGTLYSYMEWYPYAIDYLLRALRIRLVKLGYGHTRSKNSYDALTDSYHAQHGETESFLPWLRRQLNAEEKRALDELLGA